MISAADMKHGDLSCAPEVLYLHAELECLHQTHEVNENRRTPLRSAASL